MNRYLIKLSSLDKEAIFKRFLRKATKVVTASSREKRLEEAKWKRLEKRKILDSSPTFAEDIVKAIKSGKSPYK